MRGRKPKPTALKLLQGTARKSRMNKREPKPTGPVTCPDWLSVAAKAEWRRIAPVLVKAGIATAADRGVLALYCTWWARAAEAEREIAKTAAVVKSPSGFPIQNPWLSIAAKASTLMLKFAAELGITPSSRTRVSAVSQSEAASRLEKFIGSKGGGL
ncbi:MAG: phage terminase small subunit P27 family [Planctomycetes bacterium]|nr:phage terminase small subunit P27 family [Planctomycetota bacterium]